MKLHRLAVRDFKGIQERDILVPDAGILVLEGPNEIGKSSMLEALDLLLEHKDSSRRAQIRAARPVGRDVGPFVEVELSTGPYRFTYRKRWLRQASTELDIVAPARLHFVGDEAHERVRAMLAETADMSLWRALRLLQAIPLNQGDFAGSSALAAALDAAAGTAPDTGGVADTLLAATEAVYLRYFTVRHGAPTGVYRAAVDRHERACEALLVAQAAVDEVAHDVAAHDRLESALRDAQEQLESARRERDRLAQCWAQVREVVERLGDAKAHRDELALAVVRETERRTQRAESAATLQARGVALGQAQEQADLLGEQLEPASTDLAGADEAYEAAVAAERAARERLDRVTGCVARDRMRAERAALSTRIRRIDACARDVAQARAAVDANPVTAQILRGVETAHQVLELAEATQRAGSAAIVMRTLAGKRTVQVDGTDVILAPEGAWTAPISRDVRLVLPGKVEVELRPEAGAAQRGEAVLEARRRVEEVLRDAGAPGVAAARDAHERRREQEAARLRSEEQLSALLDGSARADLLETMERLQATLGDGDDAQPDPGVGPEAGLRVDPQADAQVELDPAARLEAARQEETSGREEVLRCAARRQVLHEQVQTLRLELARADSLVGAVRAQLSEQEVALRSARAVRSDADLEAGLTGAVESLAAAQQRVDGQQALLAEQDAQGLELLHQGATAEVEGLQKRVRSLAEERIRVQARLEHAGSQGRAEAFDAAGSEAQHAASRLATARRHAEAAKLLRTTLIAKSQEAKRAYVRPFSDAIARLGRIVYGPSFEVEVDEALTIQARILFDQRIPYDALSTGAKEQLAIITRLACASIIDSEHGVPVVIDDALGYSDPDKLRRVCATFGRLGGAAQVILLTCTPGRYASVGEAQVVRL